jgi:hypothetical protein
MGIGLNLAALFRAVSGTLRGLLNFNFHVPGLEEVKIPLWAVTILVALLCFWAAGLFRRK